MHFSWNSSQMQESHLHNAVHLTLKFKENMLREKKKKIVPPSKPFQGKLPNAGNN